MSSNKCLRMSILLAFALSACSKSVSVEGEVDVLSQTAMNSSEVVYSSGAFPEAGSSANQSLLDQINPGNLSSQSVPIPLSSGQSQIALSSGALSSETPYSEAQQSSGIGISSSFFATSSSARLSNLKILTSLNSIQLPAFSTQGIHLQQFQNDGTLGVLAVSWDGQSQWMHTEAGLKYAFTTGSGSHRASLLNLGMSWPLYADVSTMMTDGSNRYKEFLTSNTTGIYWVDYGVVASSGGGGSGSGGGFSGSSSVSGKIYFQPWSGGATTALTDSIPYRARLDASETHLTWVEYAPGASIGKIMVMDLQQNRIQAAASSGHHQDRPAIDGDYLVWEEYLDASNAVIRCMQISTGTVRDISSNVGFRTNPDVLAGRAIWEDQRTGNGDLWYRDLIHGVSEQILVQGLGHSAGVRLYQDKVIWIESNGSAMGLAVGTW